MPLYFLDIMTASGTVEDKAGACYQDRGTACIEALNSLREILRNTPASLETHTVSIIVRDEHQLALCKATLTEHITEIAPAPPGLPSQ